jgi:hypothetical protein
MKNFFGEVPTLLLENITPDMMRDLASNRQVTVDDITVEDLPFIINGEDEELFIVDEDDEDDAMFVVDDESEEMFVSNENFTPQMMKKLIDKTVMKEDDTEGDDEEDIFAVSDGDDMFTLDEGDIDDEEFFTSVETDDQFKLIEIENAMDFLAESIEMGAIGKRIQHSTFLNESQKYSSPSVGIILEVADKVNKELSDVINTSNGDTNEKNASEKISKIAKLFSRIRLNITNQRLSAKVKLTLFERMLYTAVSIYRKYASFNISDNIRITILPESLWVMNFVSKLVEASDRRDTEYTRNNVDELISIYEKAIIKAQNSRDNVKNTEGENRSLDRLLMSLNKTLGHLHKLKNKEDTINKKGIKNETVTLESLTEAARARSSFKIQNVNKKFVPVFIVLTRNDTLMGKAIRTITKEYYNHASITFDHNLKHMYSFARRDDGKGGFIIESKASGEFSKLVNKAKNPTEYSLYCSFVSEEKYKKMVKKLNQVIKNADDYRYNILQLLKMPLGFENFNDKAMVCSEFVGNILKEADESLPGKKPSLATPGEIVGPKFFHISKGFLKDYQPSHSKRTIENLMNKQVKKVKKFITESSILGTSLEDPSVRVISTPIVKKDEQPFIVKGENLNEAEVNSLLEALSAKDRKKLKDNDFGLPKLRKYPLIDDTHVYSAISYFNTVSKENEKELAGNILKAIDKFGLSPTVSKNNRFSKYYKPTTKTESVLLPTHHMTLNESFELTNMLLLKKPNSPLVSSSIMSLTIDRFYPSVSMEMEIYRATSNGGLNMENEDGDISVVTDLYNPDVNAFTKLRIPDIDEDHVRFSYRVFEIYHLLFTLGTVKKSVNTTEETIIASLESFFTQWENLVRTYYTKMMKAYEKNNTDDVQLFKQMLHDIIWDYRINPFEKDEVENLKMANAVKHGLIHNINEESFIEFNKYMAELGEKIQLKNDIYLIPELNRYPIFNEESLKNSMYLYAGLDDMERTSFIDNWTKLYHNMGCTFMIPENLIFTKVLIQQDERFKDKLIKDTVLNEGIKTKRYNFEIDEEGNLLIKKKYEADLEKTYRDSLLVLKQYKKAGNVDGVKEEIAKIFYIKQLLDIVLIRTKTKDLTDAQQAERKKLMELRALVMNSWTQYLQYVLQEEPSFNFMKFYDASAYGADMKFTQKELSLAARLTGEVLKRVLLF